MYQRLKNYLASLESVLAASDAGTDWDALIADIVAQISFFQHERLCHLLVTLAFALMELAATITTLIIQQILSVILMVLLLVLLVPYVVHYYYLENGTQELYGLYDRALRLRESFERR